MSVLQEQPNTNSREAGGSANPLLWQAYRPLKPIRGRPQHQEKAMNELSNQQIAEVMGINYQSVINFVQKALQNLEKSLTINSVARKLYSLFF